jgi:uncharacterized membrane protein
MNGDLPDQYRVTGPDGKSYGPVRLPVLADWVREGRVTRASLVRRGDEPAVPAGSLPELAGAFPAPDPFHRPPEPEAPPFPSAAPIPRELHAWGLIEQGWGLVTEDWMVYGVMFLLMSLLSFTVNLIPYAGPVMSMLLTGPLMVGMWRALLGRIDGRPARVEMLFSGFDRFWDAFVAMLLTSVITGVGFALCIVPGLFLLVVWAFALPIIAETRLGFWEAMQTSVQITRGYRWKLFLLLLAGVLVSILGLLVCVVGFFIALPVFYFALGLAYRFLQEEARRAAATTAASLTPSASPEPLGDGPPGGASPGAEPEGEPA